MVIKINYTSSDVYVSTSVSPVYVVVNYSSVNNGGGAIWGGITGTLSDQTDLQDALDDKVPYTGATADVNLGEFGINLGNAIFDTTPTGIPTEQGAMYWDADAETVALIMNGTIQKIGEDMFYHVRNTTGSTIPKGTAVRFSGTTGNSGRLLIAPMLANGTYPSQYYMGITSEELLNNEDGKVYHFGKMRAINTSAFTDGAILYVSPSVAGALTATPPVAPNNIIIAAAVVHAANNGTLMIRTTLGSNINSDEGVLITTPANNEALIYESATSLWKNKTIATALGYTPISGSGATGQVAYWNGTNSQTGSNNLFWDAANARLGIGTNSPARVLSVTSATNGNAVRIEVPATNTTVYDFYLGNAADSSYIRYNPVIAEFRRSGAASTIRTVGGALNDLALQADGSLTFFTNGANERMRVFNSTGNLLIQNGGTFTDGGQRLQVVGTSYFSDRIGFNSTATTNVTLRNELPISGSTNSFGYYTSSIIQSGVTSSASYFSIAPQTQAASFTLSRLSGFEVNALSIGAGSTITEASAFYGNIASGTGRWNLYMAGTADNYLAGRLSIGTTGQSQGLRIGRNPTSSDSTSNFVNVAIQSSVTSAYRAFASSIGLNASGFTLPNLSHFEAIQDGAFTAGVVTNHYGFRVNALISGTNVFGFHSNLSSATGVWNLYMAGTANNYLGGELLINTLSSVAGYQVAVGGGIYSSGNIRFDTAIRDNRDNSIITQSISSVTVNRILTIGNGTYLNINFPNGNILVGTTTDAGFKLDVNGTARVNSKAFFGNGTSYIYTSFQSVVNTSSSSSAYFEVSGAASNSSAMLFTKAGNLSTMWNLGTDASNDFYLFRHGINKELFKVFDTSTNVGIDNSAAITDIASAKLFVNSTTKGFLPPRMTNAQRTAISSPAVGLIVYCTDATEGLYQYTSAGWANLNGVVTNRQTASYTLALTDINDLVEMNVATANNLTVPLNSSVAFPIGTKIDIAQYGAGQTTVVATSGVTVRSAGGALKLAVQYSGATLVKIGTDEWYLFGDITV